MDPNANRSSGNRAPGADAYWQRRFFTLIAGLAVIGLLAWAVSGVASGGNSSKSSGSSGPSAAAFASTTAGTPSPSAPVTSAAASPSPRPSASPSPSASASKSAAASAQAHPAQAHPAEAHPAQAHPARAASGPAACPAADLVLTVVASQASYAKATPSFQVDVVSTSSATCTLDIGPEALKLVVTHGSTVAYDSTACLHDAPRHVISLRRGVPVITSLAWNEHETVNGCPATVLAAPNRTYAAAAQAGGAQSPKVSFKLAAAPATTAAKPTAGA